MVVVAIARLGTALEDEARALARELGILPYEARLKLKVGLPAIVLATPDEERARTLAEALRGRGHQVVSCRARDVTPIDDMIELRRFQLEPGGLVAAHQGQTVRLAWSDVAVLVRALHRTTLETRTVTAQQRIAPVRAVLTGGLMISKTTTQEKTGHALEHEAVLYLFPRSAGPPWCLRERRASYDVLGAAVTPSSFRNFERVVEQLRTRAGQAAYDDRLVARKGAPGDVDLLAHLLASSVTAAGAAPFR